MADAKQGKPPIEDFYNGPSQSRVVLAKPRLGGFGASSFAASSSKACNPFGSVLRPSQLKPGSNPFLKVTETPDNADSEKEKDPESSEDRLIDEKEEVEIPKFVPLGSANVASRTSNPVPAPAQPTTSNSSSGFVFGQNLSERVMIKEAVNNGDASVDHSSTNGTTELLFTAAAASVMENQEEAGPSEPSSGSDGLAAAAAEYERSHARPPPPTASYNITGEEGEINVIQISCRLFAWESGSWRERGRGVLRLNDAAAGSGGAARLVVRVAGSLRVVLNTQLWPDMVVERAGTKSLRITGADAQHQVKLFLIMGAPTDIVQLNRALSARIAVSKRSTCAQNTTSQKAAERLEAATDDNEFLDKHVDTSYEEGFGHTPIDTDKEQSIKNDRLQDSEQKTDAPESHVDNEEAPNPLKRKEPADDDAQPKRQCPEILIQ